MKSSMPARPQATSSIDTTRAAMTASEKRYRTSEEGRCTVEC
jgi:hypothetical protein